MYENEIFMGENETSMHEDEISMRENVNSAPKIFMGEKSMHEAVYSPTTPKNFLGRKNDAKFPFSCMETSFTRMESSYFHA